MFSYSGVKKAEGFFCQYHMNVTFLFKLCNSNFVGNDIAKVK